MYLSIYLIKDSYRPHLAYGNMFRRLLFSSFTVQSCQFSATFPRNQFLEPWQGMPQHISTDSPTACLLFPMLVSNKHLFVRF